MTSDDRAGHYAFKPGRLSSHGRILRTTASLPRTSRILEVGTASGYLGRELRALGFPCVVGVERDADSASAARPYYAALIVADVERDALGEELGAFDALICADVLEHLRDPLAQLRALAERLKPSGLAIVSLPNAVNWTVRLSVLRGRFAYTDRGLLDRGHLRFFTRRTATALIEEAGFVIERCDPTPIPIGLAATWLPEPLARAAETGYYGITLGWPSLFAYQLVFVARKKP